MKGACTKLFWHNCSCGSSDEEDGEVGGLVVGGEGGGSSQGVSPGPSSDTDALSSVAPSPSPGKLSKMQKFRYFYI